MAEKKRAVNIELLRIVNMLMVVGIHYIRESGRLLTTETEVLSSQHVAAMLFEAFFIIMIDAYVFISGYYGISGRFKPSKLLSFLCRVWFYCLLIPVALSLFGVPVLSDSQGIYGILQYIFPVGNEHYWFITAYFYIMLFTPLLNIAVKALNKEQLAVVVICFLVVFCGVKSIIPLPFALDKGGYDVLWLICVYLLAAWFRLYGGAVEAWVKKHSIKIYLGSCLLSWGMILVLWKLASRFDGLSYYFGVPLHHNFILCLTGAIGLFYTFSKIRIKNDKISDVILKVSKYSLGVYLLHEHLDMRTIWYPALTGWMEPYMGNGMAAFLAGLVFCVVVLFVAGVCIDFIREKIFGVIYLGIKKTPVADWLHKLDDVFAKKEG